MKPVSPLGFFQLLFLVVLSVQSLIAQPTLHFSHERGFYKNSFELTLTANQANSLIIYTLDGSDPAISSNRFSGTSPVTLLISPYNSEGRASAAAVIVRALAENETEKSKTLTQTYIFLNEVKYQPNVSPDLAPYWPDRVYMPSHYSPELIDWMRTEKQFINLDVDPKVVHNEDYFSLFEDALKSIPTLSLVTDPNSLFDPDTGIYINGTYSGMGWERSGSIELIDPENDEFQANTGIRIRGGWSSAGNCPKHSFRLFFRKEYGDAKLIFPLFASEGTNSFDKIDLRSSQNNSWHAGNMRANYIHDCFSRDIQGEMGQPYTRSRYYHLYLNGMYWGLYQTQERAEARFAESYLGGDKSDYDVIKSSGPSIDYPSYTLEATDGNLDAARELWKIAMEGFSHSNYMKAMGMNPDGTKNTDFVHFLDPDNLIDYMMIIYFSANTDGPGELNGGIRINNFFGIFNREKPDGFKFCIHDNETAYNYYKDNIVNRPTLAGWEFSGFNPAWLHQQLILNPDYRQRFYDRAYNYLFNQGILTENVNIARFEKRRNEIFDAMVGESARWGNLGGSKPLTRNNTWIPAVNNLLEKYFPLRTQELIKQFLGAGWINTLLPPVFDESDLENHGGGIVIMNESFMLINPNETGEIYYTTDLTDPRAPGGTVAEKALAFTGEIHAGQTCFLKARIKAGNEWSPLTERIIYRNPGIGLQFTEISYHPADQVIEGDTLKGKNLEFIEIKNNGPNPADLSLFAIRGGIEFLFPVNTIVNHGSFVVIASDSASFFKLYGFKPFGQYKGNLNNAGESVCLKNPSGHIRAGAEYNKDEIWYPGADGTGYTLVLSENNSDSFATNKNSWRVSSRFLGSPEADDPIFISPKIVFSEVRPHSVKPLTDAIELHNQGNEPVDISHWYLSNEKGVPAKWKIPEGSILDAKGYLTFYEGHYQNDSLLFSPVEFGSSFSLSSGGEQLFLYSSQTDGIPGNFIAAYEFGPAFPNVTFGTFLSSAGNSFNTLLLEPSFGNPNSEPYRSPVIFKTIHYHPVENNYEYIVLKNRTDSVIHLFFDTDPSLPWKVDGISFTFPEGISLEPRDSLFLAEKAIPENLFRSVMKIPGNVQVFSYCGKLKNSGETLAIQCPVFIADDSSVAYISLEKIDYSDNDPWPKKADGKGYALYRNDEESFSNDPANWGILFSAFPIANAGSNRHAWLYSEVVLDGSKSYDPGSLPLAYFWEVIGQPEGATVTLQNSGSEKARFTPATTGEYLFTLTVGNGEFQSVPSFVSVWVYENNDPITESYTRTIKVAQYETAILTGNDSWDPDYNDLFYLWEILEVPTGSMASIDVSDQKEITLIPDLPGTYRVNLMVNDGFLFGKTITIRVIASPLDATTNLSEKPSLIVYPNPAKEVINILFGNTESNSVTISLSGINGKNRVEKSFPVSNRSTIEIPVNTAETYFLPGVYLLTVTTDSFTETRKIVLIR